MEENKPISLFRQGKFQISLWESRFPNNGAERACIQHSHRNKEKKWVNQRIWCSVDELRDLVQVIDELNQQDNENDN